MRMSISRPILRLGSAGAGADLQLRIAKVIGSRQQRAQPQAPRDPRRLQRSPRRARATSRRPDPTPSMLSSSCALCNAPLDLLERVDPALERLHLLHDGLRGSADRSRTRAPPCVFSSLVRFAAWRRRQRYLRSSASRSASSRSAFARSVSAICVLLDSLTTRAVRGSADGSTHDCGLTQDSARIDRSLPRWRLKHFLPAGEKIVQALPESAVSTRRTPSRPDRTYSS